MKRGKYAAIADMVREKRNEATAKTQKEDHVKEIYSAGFQSSGKYLQILVAEEVKRETIIEDIKKAVDALSGDVKTCTECNQTTYMHEDFICQDCGTQGGLRAVK